jgi:hypothetical protein
MKSFLHLPSTATRFLPSSWIVVASTVLVLSSASETFGLDADFHYLAADPSLRAQMNNVTSVMGQATHVGKVLQCDQPWESPYQIGYPGTVLRDSATGQWRMYYELCVPGQEFQRGVAMATSNDGINWTKPALNATGSTYTTSTQNNFVSLPQTWMGGPCVFVDPNAPANQRYRMSVTVNETTLNGLTSAGGVTWTSSGLADNRGSHAALDSLNVTLWDSNTQKYTEYGRWWYGNAGYAGRRGVYMKQSASWDGTWSGSRQFILDPASLIPAGSTNYFDIYTPAVQTYHGQYVALPAIYHHPGSWSTSGAVYPSFMYSRDGTNWSMPDAYHSMIDLSAHGKTESDVNQGSYTTTSMVEHDGQLYIYYSYFDQNHNSGTNTSGEIHLDRLPVDRFVGIQSTPGNVGTWTTSAITLSDDPGRLIVNATVDGSLRVEVLDASTQAPLTGFTLGDATPLAAGDFLDAVAHWGGVEMLNALAGRSIALRFTMDDATVYGFHFQPAPEPSTIVLLAVGLSALLAYAWRKRR